MVRLFVLVFHVGPERSLDFSRGLIQIGIVQVDVEIVFIVLYLLNKLINLKKKLNYYGEFPTMRRGSIRATKKRRMGGWETIQYIFEVVTTTALN